MNGDAGGDLVTVRLVVEPDEESGPEAGDALARRLRAELAELDVESVELAAGGPPPEGAKSADVVTMGAVMVALSASGGVFTSLIDAVRDWLGRQPRGHRVAVTIDGDTIELEKASSEQRQELVDAFVRRHSPPE